MRSLHRTLSLGIILTGFLLLSSSGVAQASPPIPTLHKGDTVRVDVSVDPHGVASNAFAGTLRFPSAYLNFNRSSFSGGICDLPVESPSYAATEYLRFACGSVTTVSAKSSVISLYFTSKYDGRLPLIFTLSNCHTLAADGLGSEVGRGCLNYSALVNGAPGLVYLNPSVITPAVSHPGTCTTRTGDLSCDGKTNLTDLSILTAYWGTYSPLANISTDPQVDLRDFSILMFYYQPVDRQLSLSVLNDIG